MINIQNNILFIGEYNTGKTSIINKYIHNIFSLDYISSEYHTYNRFSKCYNNTNYKYHIWETNYINYYSNNNDIIVFVFDINKLDTLNNLIKYIKFIHSSNNNPYKIYIIANKTDLLCDDLHSQNIIYIQSFLDNIKTLYFNNIEYIQISVLNDININCLFNSIIKTCINKHALQKCKIKEKSEIDLDTDNYCCKCICC